MPPSATNAVFLVECLLLLVGLALLWRLGLSPLARQAPARLSAWEISLSDFFLFLWLIILGGLAAQFGLNVYQKFRPLDRTHLVIIGTGAFQGG